MQAYDRYLKAIALACRRGKYFREDLTYVGSVRDVSRRHVPGGAHEGSFQNRSSWREWRGGPLRIERHLQHLRAQTFGEFVTQSGSLSNLDGAQGVLP